MNKFKLKEDGSMLTPEFRVSFPKIFEKGMDGKFGCGMMFDKKETDMSLLEAKVEEMIKEKWGTKKPKKLTLPIMDGDESDREEREGMFYVNGKAGKYRPALVDRYKEDIADPEEFYAGCFARAVITLYSYDRKDLGKAGVSVGIRSLQKIRDGEPLVSRVSAENEFDDLPNDTEDL